MARWSWQVQNRAIVRVYFFCVRINFNSAKPLKFLLFCGKQVA
jgi:hypothetical protein